VVVLLVACPRWRIWSVARSTYGGAQQFPAVPVSKAAEPWWRGPRCVAYIRAQARRAVGRDASRRAPRVRPDAGFRAHGLSSRFRAKCGRELAAGDALECRSPAQRKPGPERDARRDNSPRTQPRYRQAMARQPDRPNQSGRERSANGEPAPTVSQLRAGCKHGSDNIADRDHSAACGAKRSRVRRGCLRRQAATGSPARDGRRSHAPVAVEAGVAVSVLDYFSFSSSSSSSSSSWPSVGSRSSRSRPSSAGSMNE
jgi:hypothetical protein